MLQFCQSYNIFELYLVSMLVHIILYEHAKWQMCFQNMLHT